MSWTAIKSLMVEQIFGNMIMVGIAALFLILIIFAIIRTPKFLFIILAAYGIFEMANNEIFPQWTMFISVIFLGILISKGIINLFSLATQ
jgi:hypothetical protein